MKKVALLILALLTVTSSAFAVPKKPKPAKPRVEYFANCKDLNKVYPHGVKKGHPAYRLKLDRNKDGWACERN
jgi:hypothetical protein